MFGYKTMASNDNGDTRSHSTVWDMEHNRAERGATPHLAENTIPLPLPLLTTLLLSASSHTSLTDWLFASPTAATAAMTAGQFLLSPWAS